VLAKANILFYQVKLENIILLISFDMG
jgi:hypothetical protein